LVDLKVEHLFNLGIQMTRRLTMSEVETEFLFEARVALYQPPIDVGAGPEGHRAIYFVKSGTFEGPKLRG
jgi:Protein of unknown function (DUF3237)